MANPQPKLFKTGGPIFEFGPGWGAKAKKWFKKYILGAECSICRLSRYILLLSIVILLFGRVLFKNTDYKFPDDFQKKSVGISATIVETVQKNDSKIKIARRALSDYLIKYPDTKLSRGQKAYIETVLGQRLSSTNLTVGAKIDFFAEDLNLAIKNSFDLTASQLQRWEAAAKNIKF